MNCDTAYEANMCTEILQEYQDMHFNLKLGVEVLNTTIQMRFHLYTGLHSETTTVYIRELEHTGKHQMIKIDSRLMVMRRKVVKCSCHAASNNI
jgi:hypothetical protein